jgi:hypothetical protein
MPFEDAVRTLLNDFHTVIEGVQLFQSTKLKQALDSEASEGLCRGIAIEWIRLGLNNQHGEFEKEAAEPKWDTFKQVQAQLSSRLRTLAPQIAKENFKIDVSTQIALKIAEATKKARSTPEDPRLEKEREAIRTVAADLQRRQTDIVAAGAEIRARFVFGGGPGECKVVDPLIEFAKFVNDFPQIMKDHGVGFYLVETHFGTGRGHTVAFQNAKFPAMLDANSSEFIFDSLDDPAFRNFFTRYWNIIPDPLGSQIRASQASIYKFARAAPTSRSNVTTSSSSSSSSSTTTSDSPAAVGDAARRIVAGEIQNTGKE